MAVSRIFSAQYYNRESDQGSEYGAQEYYDQHPPHSEKGSQHRYELYVAHSHSFFFSQVPVCRGDQQKSSSSEQRPPLWS